MKLENEYVSIDVTTCGGSLNSIYDKKRNEELLYQPHLDSWSGQDIFIFPFIARLKNGYYLHNGKRYDLKNHGLLRYMIGEDESVEGQNIKVVFKSDDKTLIRYPFSFEASITYVLNGNAIEISYDILNTGYDKLPFEMGAHPAFKLPGVKKKDEFDIRGNYIKFDKVEKLKLVELEETASFVVDTIDYLETDTIALSKKLFNDINTIILKADDFKEVHLVKKDGSILTIDKGNAPYIALWSDKKFGDYIAIEPWFGLPDLNEPEREIYNKPNMLFLNRNEHFKFAYKIKIN